MQVISILKSKLSDLIFGFKNLNFIIPNHEQITIQNEYIDIKSMKTCYLYKKVKVNNNLIKNL